MTQWSRQLDEHIWPQIRTMLFHDCLFTLWARARELASLPSSGPVAWFVMVGHFAFQAMVIRGLRDTLRQLLAEVASQHPVSRSQCDVLGAKLAACDRVCDMATNLVAHTPDPQQRQGPEAGEVRRAELTVAHRAICEVAVRLDRDILRRKNPVEIMPVPQYSLEDAFRPWLPAPVLPRLWGLYEECRRQVNAYIPRSNPP